MRIWLAIRAFFGVLFNGQIAARIGPVLRGEASASPSAPVAEESPKKKSTAASAPAAPKRPARSEAITLLATLQREARFVDIVSEPLEDYSDQQIGAAARDVLRDCGSVLERFFAIQPMVDESEGAELEAPADFDAGRYCLSGEISGEPPFRGKLVHHGWQATRCQLPQWSGSDGAAMVVAPVELEVS